MAPANPSWRSPQPRRKQNGGCSRCSLQAIAKKANHFHGGGGEGGQTLIIPSGSKIPKNRVGVSSSQFLVIIIKIVEIITQGLDTVPTQIDQYHSQNCPCPSPHRYFARDGHAESAQRKGEVT